MAILTSARRYSTVLLLLCMGVIALARGSMTAGSVAPAAVKPEFTWLPTSPAAGQAVQFTDESTGGPTYWCWGFGDGNGSTMQNPTHVYAAPGTYTVWFISGAGASGGFVEHPIFVGSSIGAAFTWSPPLPRPGQGVQFTDQSSGSPTYWSWDFGDGSSSTDRNPVHTYDATGPYTVELVVRSGSFSSTVSQRIVVAVPVSAAFTWSPAPPTAGQRVQFTDRSTGTRAFWCWNFGDNSASSLQNPTHVYAAPGTYSVNLMTLGDGGTGRVSQSVIVVPPRRRAAGH